MLINESLYTIFTIITPIAFLIGLSVFVKKKFDSYYGVFFGFILSGLIFGALQATAGKVYIINADLNSDSYRTIGSFKFDFATKKTKLISIPQGKTIVINNSSNSIVVDQLTYGTDGYFKNKSDWKEIIKDLDSNYSDNNSSTNSYFLEPYSYEALSIDYNTIDFFFDDEIPQEIEEFGVRGNVTKYWLHNSTN